MNILNVAIMTKVIADKRNVNKLRIHKIPKLHLNYIFFRTIENLIVTVIFTLLASLVFASLYTYTLTSPSTIYL